MLERRGLPQGVSNIGGQASTDTRIIVTVAVSVNAPIGPNSITVTASGQTSNQGSFTLDGPFYMIVQYDAIGWCSGCSTTRERDVTYQVMNFSQTPAGSISIGESLNLSGWTCNQQYPGYSGTVCGTAGTASDGSFTDSWSLASDSYSPVGCGVPNVTDEWNWCATSPARGIGHLSGYIHTDTISINGVVNPPNQFVQGTVINP